MHMHMHMQHAHAHMHMPRYAHAMRPRRACVNCSSLSPTLRLMPALSTSVSSGLPACDAANARTDARLARSHAAPVAMPPARRAA